MGCSANVAELPEWAGELLAHSRVARLGLLDERGDPRVLPVTYALSGGALVSAVDDKPKRRPGERLARVRWLRARPRAALTVDRYTDDWSQLAWVQALGSVRVVDAASASEALAALSERYAAYRERRPAGPVLVIEPERILWWRASDAQPAVP
jgi:PPOX class probable F420-dependent enzyme